MTIVKSDVRNYCNYSCLLLVKSLLWLPFLFLGTSTATPGVLSLSGGSCSGSSGSSIGYAPVTETYLPRDFGPHQGGVSVPPDTVPQVSVQQFCIINRVILLSHCMHLIGRCSVKPDDFGLGQSLSWFHFFSSYICAFFFSFSFFPHTQSHTHSIWTSRGVKQDCNQNAVFNVAFGLTQESRPSLVSLLLCSHGPPSQGPRPLTLLLSSALV